MVENDDLGEMDDAGVALQLLACTRQIRQGVARLRTAAQAGAAGARAGIAHNWMEYEHCRNALGQLIDNTRVHISEPYQSEADGIHVAATAVLDAALRGADAPRADELVRRAEQFYKKSPGRRARCPLWIGPQGGAIDAY